MLIRLLYCPASPAPATLHDFDRLPIVIGPRAGSHLAVPDGIELVLAERAGALVAVRPGRDDMRLEAGGTRQLTADGAAIVVVTIDLSEGAGSDVACKLQDMLADLYVATGAAPVPASHAQMFDEVYRAIRAHHLFIRTLHNETDLPGVAPVDLAQAFGATRTWICQAREFHAQLSKIMGTTDRATILSDVALEQRGRQEGERAIAELDKLRADMKAALKIDAQDCDGPTNDALLVRAAKTAMDITGWRELTMLTGHVTWPKVIERVQDALTLQGEVAAIIDAPCPRDQLPAVLQDFVQSQRDRIAEAEHRAASAARNAADHQRWHVTCRDALERVLSRFMPTAAMRRAAGNVGTEVMERAIDGLPTSATITEASAYLAVLARVHEVFDNLQAGRAGRLGGAWRLFEVGWRADMTIDEAHCLLERQRTLREGTGAREPVPFRRPPSGDAVTVLDDGTPGNGTPDDSDNELRHAAKWAKTNFARISPKPGDRWYVDGDEQRVVVWVRRDLRIPTLNPRFGLTQEIQHPSGTVTATWLDRWYTVRGEISEAMVDVAPLYFARGSALGATPVEVFTFSDASAALGKTNDELAAAVEDAASGPFERLRDVMASTPSPSRLVVIVGPESLELARVVHGNLAPTDDFVPTWLYTAADSPRVDGYVRVMVYRVSSMILGPALIEKLAVSALSWKCTIVVAVHDDLLADVTGRAGRALLGGPRAFDVGLSTYPGDRTIQSARQPEEDVRSLIEGWPDRNPVAMPATFDADAAMRETVSADAIVGRMVRDLLGVGAGEVVGRVQSLLAAPAAALPCVVTRGDLRPGDLAWYPSRGDGPSLLHVGTHVSAWRQLDGSRWGHADLDGHDPGLAIVLIARGLQEPTPAAPTAVAVAWQEAELKAQELLRCVSVTAERLGMVVPAQPVADHPEKRETNHTAECDNKGNPHDDIAETLRQTRQDAAKLEDEVVSLSERNSVLTGLLADVLGVSEAADLRDVAERVIHARSENFNALEEQLRLADSDRNAIQNFLSGLGFNVYATPFALPEALEAADTAIRALRNSDRARLRDLCKWVITLPGLLADLERQLRAAVWPDHSGTRPSPFAAVSTIAMARRLRDLSAEVMGHSGDTSGDDLEFAVAYLERWLPQTIEEKCGRAAAVAVEADRASDARESADLRRRLEPALRLVDELTRERDAESDRRVEVQQTSEQHSVAWSKLVAEIQGELNEQRDLRIAAERADVNAALMWLDRALAFVDKHKDGWMLRPGQDQLEPDRRGFVAPAAPHGSSGAADA